jgi:hypothetical protein
MPRTLEGIRKVGLEALRQRLGRAGMIRFLQQYEMGSGDYANERRARVDRISLDDLRALAGGKPRKRMRRTQ